MRNTWRFCCDFCDWPAVCGEKAYISQILGLSAQELAERAVWDVQDLAAEADNLEELARTLARREIVIATEVGGGVIPVQAEQRRAREAAGRLSCLLAARADIVVRVCCGLPQLLKGEWPCSSI